MTTIHKRCGTHGTYRYLCNTAARFIPDNATVFISKVTCMNCKRILSNNRQRFSASSATVVGCCHRGERFIGFVMGKSVDEIKKKARSNRVRIKGELFWTFLEPAPSGRYRRKKDGTVDLWSAYV